jgi:hypothetical protein
MADRSFPSWRFLEQTGPRDGQSGIALDRGRWPDGSLRIYEGASEVQKRVIATRLLAELQT